MSRPPDTNAAHFKAMREAADWYALLQSGRVGTDERLRLQRWLEARLEHRQAWSRVEAIGRQFELPAEWRGAVDATLSRAVPLQPDRRRAMKLLMLGGGGAGLWVMSRLPIVDSLIAGLGADQRTAIGETRGLRLDDGTQLWLNTDTAVNTDYDSVLRRLQLRRGEILIETAFDTQVPKRSFVVDSAQGRLHALGTRFVVRQLDAATQLTVFEGRVEVRPRDAAAATRVVNAGEQLSFTRTAIGASEPAQLARQAWSRNILLAEDVPLGEFVAELARYRRGHLACDPAIADLRVVGGFPLDEPDRVLALLQAALPVRIEAPLPWWVSVVPRS